MANAKAWNAAIRVLDKTEPEIRDVIERGLVNIAALEHIRYGEAMKKVDQVVAKVAAIRTRAIKQAFRIIRDEGGV
jgi:hypothetical protein